MFIFPYKRNLLLTVIGATFASLLAYQSIKNHQINGYLTRETGEQKNNFSQKEAWEREQQPTLLPNACKGAGGTGEYKGFTDNRMFILTQEMPCLDALANCQLNADMNPENTFYCTWNGREIFSNVASNRARLKNNFDINQDPYPCDFHNRRTPHNRSRAESEISAPENYF